VRCPKEAVEMELGQLTEGLSVNYCSSCHGHWLPAVNYQRWQSMNAGIDAIPEPVLPLSLETTFQPAPLDGKAGLCPDCGTFLKRSRLNLKKHSFYVELCPVCNGIWCDQGEWAVFEALGLHIQIPIVFQLEWQSQVRKLEQVERERMAVIEKLGPEIASRIFELGDLLQRHPQGDFGVAYLMRKFEK
jgi:Zn-finger nucleic acid-binding protein